MHILCATVSLHCGIFRYSVTNIHILFLQQLCDMSVGKPLVLDLFIMEQPSQKGNSFLQNGYMCVLKDIVDVKLRLDKNLTSFIM